MGFCINYAGVVCKISVWLHLGNQTLNVLYSTLAKYTILSFKWLRFCCFYDVIYVKGWLTSVNTLVIFLNVRICLFFLYC